MKNIIHLLIIFLPLLLLGCKKEKRQIPDEYRSLIGGWQCYNCVTPVEVEIELNKLIVKRPKKRDLIVRYRNVSSGFWISIIYEINLDKHYRIHFKENGTPIDTIELFTNDIYKWKETSSFFIGDYDTDGVLNLIRK